MVYNTLLSMLIRGSNDEDHFEIIIFEIGLWAVGLSFYGFHICLRNSIIRIMSTLTMGKILQTRRADNQVLICCILNNLKGSLSKLYVCMYIDTLDGAWKIWWWNENSVGNEL